MSIDLHGFAEAIIVRAIRDYKQACRMVCNHGRPTASLLLKQEIDVFARGGWAKELCDLMDVDHINLLIYMAAMYDGSKLQNWEVENEQGAEQKPG